MFASIRRRIVRAYQVACARDDVAGHGLTVPTGVWVCGRCQRALLEFAALREHFRTEHATP
jgi:hypothetical protein